MVAHRSMARWLTLELAGALGIAANLRFELPADFAWSIMRAAVPGIGGERAYTPARLRWRIYDTLPDFAEERGEPSVAPVRAYLVGGGARERFELADRLARVFDRCLLYRPDWIREWVRNPPPHWQARLWRRLVEAEGKRNPDRPAGHWVASIDAFRRALAGGRPEEWPRRASFFAVPALSPSYLEVLRAASGGLDLHVYILNPCREYWGDIHSPRESRLRSPDVDPAERYFSAGNEILAAWGRAGRDMIDALIDAESADAESDEYFTAPEESSRLAAVQRDVLDLRLAREAVEEDLRERPGERAGADDSIQIHVCHSAVREAEVLHDRLLGLFDSHPDLEPADVLVLAPDLARYGPAFEAVFGAAGRIPFDVARVRASDSRATGALLDLLALPRSRYPAEAVLAPLGAEAVRARFGLEETDLPLIRAWLREVRSPLGNRRRAPRRGAPAGDRRAHLAAGDTPPSPRVRRGRRGRPGGGSGAVYADGGGRIRGRPGGARDPRPLPHLLRGRVRSPIARRWGAKRRSVGGGVASGGVALLHVGSRLGSLRRGGSEGGA